MFHLQPLFFLQVKDLSKFEWVLHRLQACSTDIPVDSAFRILSRLCRAVPGQLNTKVLDALLSDFFLQDIGSVTGGDLALVLIGLGQARYQGDYAGRIVRALIEKLPDVDTPTISRLATAMNRFDHPETHNDLIVLMHDLIFLATSRVHEFDALNCVSLLNVLSKMEITDEIFMKAVCARLIELRDQLTGQHIAMLFMALGRMKIRDPNLFTALCEELHNKTDGLTEMQVNQVLKGMAQCAHQDEELMRKLIPNIKKNLSTYTMQGVSTVLSMYSRASVFDETFFKALISAQMNQLHKMQSVSLQHLLTVFARERANFPQTPTYELQKDASRVCDAFLSKHIVSSLTPIQAQASIAALAKLRVRHEPALHLFVSVLCGADPTQRGGNKSKSSHSVLAYTKLPPRPFELRACLRSLCDMDLMHFASIVQHLHMLNFWTDQSVHLYTILRALMAPQLHEMKSTALASTALAFRDFQILDLDMYNVEVELENLPSEVIPPACTRFRMSCDDAQREGVASEGGEFLQDEVDDVFSWKKELFAGVLEGLRRHTHYLETSWHGLSNVKLLYDTYRYGLPFDVVHSWRSEIGVEAPQV